MMNTNTILAVSSAIYDAIIRHEADIESLDRAIGDGDHYINIKRGCEAIVNMQSALSEQPADVALQQIGMKLLSTIGGAAGPLLASFFMVMGKTIKENGSKTNLEIAAAFAAGVHAMMQRGKSQAGEKTMLDVLIPVSHAFTLSTASDKPLSAVCQAIKEAAENGLESTRNMMATKGRAAGLGERSIGHLDAGAKSCQIIIFAVCDRLLANQN